MERLFATRAARDAAWRADGKVGRRGSIRNRLIHPMYLEDIAQSPAGQDRGCGNTVYKTAFAVIYTLGADNAR